MSSQATPLEPANLQERGIKSVVLAAPDLHGRLFGKRMDVETFLACAETGINASSCALAWDIEQNLEVEVAYTGFHTGWHDFVLRPDLTTLRPAGWLDEVAICIADLVEVGGDPVPIAPRSILRRQVDRLLAAGYDPVIGSELEFFLYRPGPDEARAGGYRNLEPTTKVHADYLIGQGNALEPFFDRLRAGLTRSGIPLEVSHCEWGYGQWEINIAHDRALTTADVHTLFKLAVKDVAAREGMVATFMARPAAEEIGSSGHVHVSLRAEDGDFPFFDAEASDRMSEVMRSAVGGCLAHAPDLMAFYAPNVNSYRRVSRAGLVSGSGCSWGYDNRTVSCRVLGKSPAALRLEWRIPGADINPYLAFAGLLGSIADGIEQRLDPGPPIHGNAYESEQRDLPRDLAAATAALKGSEAVRSWFGDEVVDHYVALAEFEWDQFMSQVTEWEVNRYFEST